MNEVIRDWEKNFYTEVPVFILVIITLYISVKKWHFFPELKLLPVYLTSFALLFLIRYTWDIFFYSRYPSKIYWHIDIASNVVVALIELATFLYYFYSTLQTKKIEKTIRLIGSIIIIAALVRFFHLLFFTPISDIGPLHNFYILESITLLLLCIIYFIELFKAPPVLKLVHSSNFWISSGLLFYIFGTFPITLITDYFFSTSRYLYENSFAIINAFYIVLFLMIIRAYSCIPEKASNQVNS